MSTFHKEPNEENHQLSFTYKKKLIFNPRSLPTTTDPKTGQPAPKDLLYVTFFAGKSCIVNVTVLTFREYSHQQMLIMNPHMTAADLNNLGGSKKKNQ